MEEEWPPTPGGRPMAAEQVEEEPRGRDGEPMSQGDVEDPGGQGGADDAGDQGRDGHPDGRSGAGATEDWGGAEGMKKQVDPTKPNWTD